MTWVVYQEELCEEVDQKQQMLQDVFSPRDVEMQAIYFACVREKPLCDVEMWNVFKRIIGFRC